MSYPDTTYYKICGDSIWSPFIVTVAGSRSLEGNEEAKEEVYSLLSDMAPDIVLTGGADGIDTMAEEWAKLEAGVESVVFEPDWNDLSHDDAVVKTNSNGNKYDALAGIRRNRKMASVADVVIVVWDGESSGSENMLEESRERSCKVVERVIGGSKQKRFGDF